MLTQSPPRPSFVPSRKWLIGLNVTISIGAAFVVLVLVNYLAANHFRRFYFTENSNYRLSKLSSLVVKSLTNKVNVVVFFSKSDEPVLYSAVTALLNEYANASPRIHVEKIDYGREPGAAQQFKEKYKHLSLPEDKSFVLFESNGKHKTVNQIELSEYNIADVLGQKAKEIKRTTFRGEQLFTSAILSVSDAKEFKSYFLQGHDESDPRSPGSYGYDKFSVLLGQYNVTRETLSLAGTNEIPQDCQLLVIAGARKSFLDSELEKLNKYLDQSGRLLVLFNSSDGGQTGLEGVLANWGVNVGPRVALDPPNADKQGIMLATNFGGHAIVSPLYRQRVFLYLPRVVERRQMGKPTVDAAKVEELISTSEGGRAVQLKGGQLHVSAHDPQGVFPVAVAVERGGIRGVSGSRGATRIVVVGDSLFLANDYIDIASNSEFARLAVNWLLDRPQLLGGIMPRPVKEYRLILTQSQRVTLRWILLAAIPGSIFLFGLLVYWRRRR
jgi:ABC-type uncharacterized transport system involved in gliding motility auxiliary subunit